MTKRGGGRKTQKAGSLYSLPSMPHFCIVPYTASPMVGLRGFRYRPDVVRICVTLPVTVPAVAVPFRSRSGASVCWSTSHNTEIRRHGQKFGHMGQLLPAP